MTREDCILYAYDHGIPITATKEKLYSIDDNLWGRAIECGEMEDPWAVPPPGVWSLTVPTATEPRDLVIGFEAGVPVPSTASAWRSSQLIEKVGAVVGAYGWGRIDMVENRRVGIKSRETYECPASLALILAHADLESITLERDLAREKARLELRYAELIYDGLWFSPLKQALDAFIDESQSARDRRGSPAPRAQARARSPAGAANTASTTTAWPPTTPTTCSATRTRPGSCACGASAVETWAATSGPWRARDDGVVRAASDALARTVRRRAVRRAARVHA